MPINPARRRGATVLFCRNIPVDLRDRFGSHEIVRSIGRATPGEARRIVHRLGKPHRKHPGSKANREHRNALRCGALVP